MDRQRLDSWLEQGILCLVCLILVAAPFLFGSTRLIDFMWIQGLTTAALVLWMIRFWVRSEYRILWPPIAWTIIAFLLYVTWCYSTADVEYAARMDFNRILVYAAIFFLVLNNFNKQEWTQIVVCVAIFVGMAAAMYAIYQFATGSRWIYNTPQPAAYHGRAGGPFVCPNHLADYLAMVLPLAFGLTLMARLNMVLKVLLCYAGIVMLGGLFVTLSRAGCATAAIGLLVLFATLLFNRDFRLKAIVAIALILIPAVWLGSKSMKAQHRMQKGFASGQLMDDRFHVWPAAVTLWRENFWTGVGPAHFDLRFRPLRPPLGQLQVRPDRVHNDYLNTLTDYGMIGFTLATLALGAFWLSVVRIWRFVRRSNDFGSRQSTRAATVLGACSGLAALLVHSAVEFNIHIPALAILAATLLAVVSGHWRFATERFWVRPGALGRIVATILCGGLAAWLGWNTFRTAREQHLILTSEKAPERSERYRASLLQAFAIDPKNPMTAYRLGESFRKVSWAAAEGYEKQAEQAMEWFDKAIALDPYTPHPFIGKGMCLHWIGRHDEAAPYFLKVMLLDPNSYYARAHFAWHCSQLGGWYQADKWSLYSLILKPTDNPIAQSLMEIARRRREEAKLPPTLSAPLPESEPAAKPEPEK